MKRKDIVRLREDVYFNPKRWEYQTIETMNKRDLELTDSCWLGVAIATVALFGVYLWMSFVWR